MTSIWWKAIALLLLAWALFVSVMLAMAQEETNGRKIYLTYCSGCHGASGKGDGPAGKGLPAKPADHTNGKVMNRYTDQYLFTVIAKGGAQVGRSAAMPAWGGVLEEDRIKEVVAYLRTLSGAARSTRGR